MKTALIIAAVVVSLGLVGLGIYFWVKRSKAKKQEAKNVPVGATAPATVAA